MGFLGRMVLWTVLLLVAIDNLGFDVTALVTGLGIGGVAVALAVQNILGDLFASLAILLDKPFVIGDTLTIGDYQGTVERIGLKTTRLRSLTGEELIFSNRDLLESRVQNFGRMRERRHKFEVGVTYDTPPEAAAEIPDVIREVLESEEVARFEPGAYVLCAIAFTWFLIPAAAIDLRTTLLPDNLTLPLLWLGLVIAALGTSFLHAQLQSTPAFLGIRRLKALPFRNVASRLRSLQCTSVLIWRCGRALSVEALSVDRYIGPTRDSRTEARRR